MSPKSKKKIVISRDNIEINNPKPTSPTKKGRNSPSKLQEARPVSPTRRKKSTPIPVLPPVNGGSHLDNYDYAPSFIEVPQPNLKRKGSFADRFQGRTSVVDNRGEQGIVAKSNKPIEKLDETKSSHFSHLH